MNIDNEFVNVLSRYDKTLTYDEKTELCSEYVSLCRKNDSTAPTSGFTKLWLWTEDKKKNFSKLLKKHGYTVQEQVHPKLHNYNLKESGIAKLHELESILKK